MLQSIYTNTGSVKSIAGLLIVTVGVSYCKNHSDEIVSGVKNAATQVTEVIETAIHQGKQKAYAIKTDGIGNWKSASKKATWR